MSRLDTFLVEAGIGTKQIVKEYVRQGKVCVNEQVELVPSRQIMPGKDCITYEGKIMDNQHKVYYMFHKPAGCVTARSDAVQKTVLDYFTDVDCRGLFPVGRLDKDTEGLLLLTNDGQFNQQLMEPERHVAKTYFFWAFGTLDEEKHRKIEEGMLLDGQGELTLPAKLDICKRGTLAQYREILPEYVVIDRKKNTSEQSVLSGCLTIHEGRKHQVKKMLCNVGCRVFYLKRVAIGGLPLDEALLPGEYRKLTEQEQKLAKQNNPGRNQET